MGFFKDKTVVMSGGSRGIGLEIAKTLGKDGANVAILAKTTEPHPKLPGTLYTAAEDIENAGGNALPLVCDIRFEEQVQDSINQVVEKFGGIDICINNASAIHLSDTLSTPMKRYDLMHNINVRGTFLLSQTCIPHLKNGKNPHILTLSPPLDIERKWFGMTLAYTTAKYGMSLIAHGLAEELGSFGIASNCLWPRTAINTAAVTNVIYLDQDVLEEEGVTDFDQYAVKPGETLVSDFFVDDNPEEWMQA